jgi:motility quorum-sensing regulator/GCU-specific mRNA interferase toxin
MEKRTPHCELSRVKELIDAGKVRATHTARTTASILGFDFKGMVAVIASLTMKDFYKSMTTPIAGYGRTCTVPRPVSAPFTSS